MEKGQLSGNRLLYLAGLTLLFVLAFSYIFDEKLDMNGDNCTYYMLSTSIAEGHGYADITNAAHNPMPISRTRRITRRTYFRRVIPC